MATYKFNPLSKYGLDRVDPKFTEGINSPVSNTTNDIWQTVTLPGAPPNSLVLVMVVRGSEDQDAGIRSVGSTLDRRVASKRGAFTTLVNTNAAGQIQIYSGKFTDTTFTYWGTF